MKKIILAASLIMMASGAMAANVGVSVTVGQPGFYGRIDIGDYPQPQLINAQPVIVQRPARFIPQRPIYLRVPPGHAKNWSKHCNAYNACGQEVYFVQDSWYNNEYAPRYRQQHGHHDRDDRGHDRDRFDKHDNKHGNKHDDRDHGHGRGHDNHRD